MDDAAHHTHIENRGRALLQHSTLVQLFKGLFEDGGLAHRFGERVTTIVTASFLFRWLTKEPDPEVIVIDLRKTYTVGPIVALLDAIIGQVTPYWRHSTAKAGLDRLLRYLERASETRIGQALVRLLVPPEPPEDEHGDAKQSGDR